MARNFARIDVTIWMDEDFRDLPPQAQHLYFILWTHPKLSYCGVVDWRPAKLSGLAGGWARGDVEEAAAILSARLFTVIDRDTEECLIRSWAKHDGLIKEPRMAVSFVNSYAEVASRTLQGVIVHEAKRLRDAQPTLAGWSKPQMVALLTKHDIDPATLVQAEANAGLDLDSVSGAFGVGLGIGRDRVWGGVKGSVSGTPTPSPTPTPNSTTPTTTARRKPETPLASDWEPTEAARTFASEHYLDLNGEADRFRLHAQANDRRARDWDAAFRMWLTKARPEARPARGTTDQRVMDHLALAEQLRAEESAPVRQIGGAA